MLRSAIVTSWQFATPMPPITSVSDPANPMKTMKPA
jgi:hypothetical protein